MSQGSEESFSSLNNYLDQQEDQQYQQQQNITRPRSLVDTKIYEIIPENNINSNDTHLNENQLNDQSNQMNQFNSNNDNEIDEMMEIETHLMNTLKQHDQEEKSLSKLEQEELKEQLRDKKIQSQQNNSQMNNQKDSIDSTPIKEIKEIRKPESQKEKITKKKTQTKISISQPSTSSLTNKIEMYNPPNFQINQLQANQIDQINQMNQTQQIISMQNINQHQMDEIDENDDEKESKEMKDQEEQQNGYVVYIACLHNTITDKQIRKYFEKFGEIISIDVKAKPHNFKKCRGFAFVRFVNAEDGKKAIEEMNGTQIDELTQHKLTVKTHSQPQSKKKEFQNQMKSNINNNINQTLNNTQLNSMNTANNMNNINNSNQLNNNTINNNINQNVNTQNNQNIPLQQQMMMDNSMYHYQQAYYQQMMQQISPNMQSQQKAMYNPNMQIPPYPNPMMPGMPMWSEPFIPTYERQKATLYISHLPQTADELFLYKNFAKFGAIEQCNCLYEPNSKVCKGVGFITYLDYNDAYRAMQIMNNKVFQGQPIKVKFKNQK